MGREIPYQPMHVRKHVSFERMTEILKSHQPKISWKRVGTDAKECVDYRVIREPVHGGGWRYMAFQRATLGKLGTVVGRFDSFELAKLGCDAHRAASARPDEPLPGASEAAPIPEG